MAVDNLVYALLGFVVLFKYCIYPVLRVSSWAVQVEYNATSHPRTVTPGWSLWGRAPGFDARGIYQMVAHFPIFVIKIVCAILTFPYYVSKVIRFHRSGDYIKDEDVFDVCTRCTLVIFGHFALRGNYVFEMVPSKCPGFGAVGNCDPQSLRIEFENTRIVSATSKNGPVTGTDRIGRNEVLVVALRNIVATWVHTSVHVASEKCALEIQANRVKILEPTSRFVSSLHEGLIHHDNFGPLGKNSPFVTVAALPRMVEQCYEFPVPGHVIDSQKNKLELYHFFFEGRRLIQQLVAKYGLNVDPENLFLALVVHGNDHDGLFQVMARINPCSSDASGSWISYWRMHCFTHMWLGHWDNPIESEMVSNYLDNPFYRELYNGLAMVNQEKANRMVVSCCF